MMSIKFHLIKTDHLDSIRRGLSMLYRNCTKGSNKCHAFNPHRNLLLAAQYVNHGYVKNQYILYKKKVTTNLHSHVMGHQSTQSFLTAAMQRLQ